MRSKGKYVVWPIYFDSSLTWREGRRMPRSLSVKQPRVEDLGKAASEAGFKPDLVKDASHPRFPWMKTGYLLVESEEKKQRVLTEIAKKLSRGQ